MIEITPAISIPEEELVFEFSRSGGPGGQKVNKTSSAVVLRFDVDGSPSLPDEVKARLREISGSGMTQAGVLVIHSRSHRSQAMNRRSALHKLVKLLRTASKNRIERKPTEPTPSSRRRRLEAKKKRSSIKRVRSYTPTGEDLE